MARRLSGSHDVGVSITASMPSAAADRKIAPILVVSTTESITAILCDSVHSNDVAVGSGRRMAQSTPRVSVYPVIRDNISRGAVYTGMEGYAAMISAASPVICFDSHIRANGRIPLARATLITLGLSTMMIPCDGLSLLRNCVSVREANIATLLSLMSEISIIAINLRVKLRKNIVKCSSVVK